jgi:peroxiredoxin Q/BCP
MAARRQQELIEVGSRPPDFRLPRLGGGEVTLAEIAAAGPALVAFFKVTCPVCQLTFPFLERIAAAGTIPVFGISQNDSEDTREFNDEFHITFPTLLDPEEGNFPASSGFGISSVPTIFLIERDGTVARVIEGWLKKEIEWLGGKAGVSVIRATENVPEWKAG